MQRDKEGGVSDRFQNLALREGVLSVYIRLLDLLEGIKLALVRARHLGAEKKTLLEGVQLALVKTRQLGGKEQNTSRDCIQLATSA